MSQTVVYCMLNQMIKSFNQFTNEVIKIGYEFEQEDFEYDKFEMVPEIQYSVKTQFCLGIHIFMIEAVKYLIRNSIKHDDLRKSGIDQIIKDQNQLILLLKPEKYDKTISKEDFLSRLLCTDQNEIHTQSKLFVFQFLANQDKERLQEVTKSWIISEIDNDFSNLILMMEQLNNFEYSDYQDVNFEGDPYAQIVHQTKKWYKENMSYQILKEHNDLHTMMDKFLRLAQVVLYETKFLAKLGEIPDNQKLKLLHQ